MTFRIDLARGFQSEVCWPIVRIGEVGKLKYGKALTASLRRAGNVPVYGSNGQCGWHDRPLGEGPTVILGRKGQGPLGVEWCPLPFWVIDTAYYVAFDLKRIEPRFFYFLVKFIGLNHLKDGTSNPSLSRDVFEQQLVPLPSRKDQIRILAVFSAYDDLIENYQRRIRILETMSHFLYREWFVHFRFPGHENHLRVDSTLGEIPKGWEVGRLEDVIVLQRGFDLPSSDRIDGNYPVVAANGITGFHNEAKVKAPCVVTGRSGTIGKVLYLQEDFWPLNTALWAKAFPRSEILYAYFLLSSIDLIQFNSGAAVPTLNRNDIHSLEVVIPPRPLQQQFQEIAESVLKQSHILNLQIENLRRTRDLLLPRLLSGQVELEIN